MDILILIYKTIITYIFLIFIMKIMGKREIGNLSTFDIIVFFIISELFSLSLNDNSFSLKKSLLPISLIVIFQVGGAFLSLKNRKIRHFLEGKPTIIIFKGKLNIENMKKQRYNIDDLYLQLRDNKISSLDDISLAILENNGKLNIITKKEEITKTYLPLIEDGKLNNEILSLYGINKNYVMSLLYKNNIKSIEEVFILQEKKDGIILIRK